MINIIEVESPKQGLVAATVNVIVTVPADTPVTKPFASTLAIPKSSLLQVPLGSPSEVRFVVAAIHISVVPVIVPELGGAMTDMSM